jgi:glycosyltransferase involved in cell wall biosynthesis
LHNLHISLTNLKNESRVLKETNSLIQHNIFKKIYIVGLWEEGLQHTQKIDTNRIINRINLKSRNLPKNIFFQSFKYIEFLFVLFFKYKNFQVVNIHSLGLLPIGVLFKLLHKTKLIYDAHEYETEIQGIKGSRKKLAKFLEKKLIRYCDRIIVVSESIADEYKKLYPDLERPFIVLNTPPYKDIKKKDIFRETFNIPKDKTIFLYQGGLSSGRGIEILLDTFKLIDDNKSVIVFMGYGELEEQIIKVSNEENNIYFHKAVTPDILLDYTSSADFGISTIEDSCLSYRYCLPNKMFEYLMADLPVIVSNLYEMKRLVENNNIGVVAKENTPQGLKQAIGEAIKLDKDELNKNIQKVKQVYNWEEQEKVLLKAYKELEV